MKRFTFAGVVSLFLLAAVPELSAAPLGAAKPFAEPLRMEVRSVCHHLRWSSKQNCTSGKTLQFVTRPPLFYPSRYFADRPHYYYEQRRYSWHMWHARQRWYGWPYRYPYYW